MRFPFRFLAAAAALAALFPAGCNWDAASGPELPPPEPPRSAVEESAPFSEPEPADDRNYVQVAADEITDRITSPDMAETEKAMAAYEYIIANTVFDQPVGLDAWRFRGEMIPSSPIPYVENRALSPLVFGIGSCEDYAAALTLLLQRMGIEALYVPGITVSVDGGFVDHAWSMAKIEEQWYHLDVQLEDNILKNDTLTYRYFMKSDKTMLASHRWGENFLAYGGLSPPQAEEIRRSGPFPACPEDYPLPPFKRLVSSPTPDRDALVADLERERRRFETENGALPPLELDILPPVFRGGTYP